MANMVEYSCFEVRLLAVDFNLWRRFLLKKAASFLDLHLAIQAACGWEKRHQFAFARRNRRALAGMPSDDSLGPPGSAAKRVKLAAFFSAARRSCLYRYDFGGNWWHDVTLVETVRKEERLTRRLLAGAGAFPPEDCGGLEGYYRCVAAATGQAWPREYGGREDRDELVGWLAGWKPNGFDLEATRRTFDR